MIRALFLILVPLALLASARPAQALSCAASYVRMISPAQQDAPLNARILVEVFAMHGQKVELDAISLRRQGSADAVKVRRRVVGSGEVRILELTPVASLAPKTAYQVVQGRGTSGYVAGQLTTGGGTDRTAPVAKELKVRFFDVEVSNPWWGPGKRRFRFLRAKLTRGAGEPALAAALWVLEGAGRIDFNKPPTTYYLDQPEGVELGNLPSSCPLTNLTLPEKAGKAGKLRVGVRLVDGAGNASAPREAEVDLRKPERKH